MHALLPYFRHPSVWLRIFVGAVFVKSKQEMMRNEGLNGVSKTRVYWGVLLLLPILSYPSNSIIDYCWAWFRFLLLNWWLKGLDVLPPLCSDPSTGRDLEASNLRLREIRGWHNGSPNISQKTFPTSLIGLFVAYQPQCCRLKLIILPRKKKFEIIMLTWHFYRP